MAGGAWGLPFSSYVFMLPAIHCEPSMALGRCWRTAAPGGSHPPTVGKFRFYVDDIPIRVYKNNEAKGVPYPSSQPMAVYSTLWNADNWATRGGLEKIDWSKSPFYAYYKDFDIEGCAAPGVAACIAKPNNWWDGPSYQQLDPFQARKYRWVRVNHMVYDYCTDKSRFPVTPPECLAGI